MVCTTISGRHVRCASFHWECRNAGGGVVASRGIRDRVAIVGMGCTRFGERWDASTDDLLTDAVTAALSTIGRGLPDVDAFWLGTHTSGNAGLTLSRPLRLAN